MNINRHNYEAFFLLYVDNELSAAEKNAVEVFIHQNPDLTQELHLLQETILLPEAVSINKHSLLKIDTLSQEKLLLLLDRESDTAEKEAITKQIATDAAIAKEWAFIQQLKLLPDEAVLFPDKSALYKTSRERVLYFDWQKLSIAAILIGIIVWVGITSIIKKDSLDKGIVVKNNTVIQNNSLITQPKGIQSNTGFSPKDINTAQAQQPFTEQVNSQSIIKTKQAPSVQKNFIASNSIKNKLVSTVMPTQNIYIDSSNKNDPSTVSLQRMTDKVSVLQNDMAFNNKTAERITPDNKNIYAIPSSLTDNTLDENNMNDDHVSLVPVKKLQQTKAGRFFTKLKNAGKKGIHIANIEFAIQQ